MLCNSAGEVWEGDCQKYTSWVRLDCLVLQIVEGGFRVSQLAKDGLQSTSAGRRCGLGISSCKGQIAKYLSWPRVDSCVSQIAKGGLLGISAGRGCVATVGISAGSDG